MNDKYFWRQCWLSWNGTNGRQQKVCNCNCAGIPHCTLFLSYTFRSRSARPLELPYFPAAGSSRRARGSWVRRTRGGGVQKFRNSVFQVVADPSLSSPSFFSVRGALLVARIHLHLSCVLFSLVSLSERTHVRVLSFTAGSSLSL